MVAGSHVHPSVLLSGNACSGKPGEKQRGESLSGQIEKKEPDSSDWTPGHPPSFNILSAAQDHKAAGHTRICANYSTSCSIHFPQPFTFS